MKGKTEHQIVHHGDFGEIVGQFTEEDAALGPMHLFAPLAVLLVTDLEVGKGDLQSWDWWWRKSVMVDAMEGVGMVDCWIIRFWGRVKIHKMTFTSLIATPKILTLLSYDGQ